MKTFRLIAPVLGLATLAGTANASIVIDNFTAGPTDLLINGGVGYQQSQQASFDGSIVGGQRDVLFEVNSNPYNQWGRFQIDPSQGASFLSSGAGETTTVKLDYDAFDVEPNDGTLHSSSTGLNLDLSSQDKLRFNFLFADLGLKTKVDLYTYGSTEAQSSGTFTVASGIDSPTSYDLNLSSLSSVSGGGVDLKNVDRIVITFDGSQKALDFGLSSVQAVPEPTSMAAIGLGLVGLASRRRKARKG